MPPGGYRAPIWTRIGRRRILQAGGGALLLSAPISGCDLLSTNPSDEKEAGSSGGKGSGTAGHPKEPPELHRKVKQGKLPRLADRLPDTPLVQDPAQRVGTYGGSWTTAMLGASAVGWLYCCVGYDGLLRWNPEWTKVIPNVTKSYEKNASGDTFTFHLRPNMKWSDGSPFTADDVVFAYDDVLRNKELSPGGVADWLAPGGKAGKVEKLGKHEVKFTFDQPNGLFLENLATPNGDPFTFFPKHYLRQFHKKYAPDVEKMAKEKKLDSWGDFFFSKVGSSMFSLEHWRNRDLPVLNAWTVTNPLGDNNRMVLERNPYYWKVDTSGSQLPYLDRVVVDAISSAETVVLKVASGDLSLPQRESVTLQSKPVLARSRSKGKYHFIKATKARMNQMMIAFNLNHQDPGIRKTFQNKDFRIGMSYAVNRQDLIDVVYQRQGKPWQGAPRPESDFYNKLLATQYTEHNLSLARQHLDRAGLDRRDADGHRLGPDGKPISFSISVSTEQSASVNALELIIKNWKAVGIKASIQTQDRTLYTKRMDANRYDAAVWFGDGGLQDGPLTPGWYLPILGTKYATLWQEWYTSGGKSGERPPEATRHQMKLYDRMKVTVEPKKRDELFKRILEIAQEEFYAIGTVLPTDAYMVVKNEMENVAEPMPLAWLYPSPGPTRPEQYFLSAA